MHTYTGPLYRALNPRWAADPLSGEGARLYGGRFNAKGTPALYTSLSLPTALREANQVGPLQPTVIVEYTADIPNIVDHADPDAGFDAEVFGAPNWRQLMISKGVAPSQTFAQSLMAKGVNGIIIPSYAKGAQPADRNLVLWKWPGLTVIDDNNVLTTLRRS